MMRKRWMLLAGFEASMEKGRLPKYVMFGELEDVLDIATFSGKREDHINSVMEGIEKSHIKPAG